MEQEFSNVTAAPKKNNTVLIIVAVVVVLLCCCCIVVVGAFALLGPTVGNSFESIEEGINQGVPEEFPYQEENPFGEESQDPDESNADELGQYIPSGGLGDEMLRADTWVNVAISAALATCIVPADGAQNTIIEVIDDPDSAGVWVERWTLPCDGGSSKAFDVTFTPAASGGTDISVEPAD
ncbi:MAG: hypothetical protein RBS68_05335 [Anaerolineales bacterium]|jgi:hypothetical protein|nr:hypothetical protein [Anaerolineales bacterium]